jgi:hypothetical protein
VLGVMPATWTTPEPLIIDLRHLIQELWLGSVGFFIASSLV